MRTFYSIQVLRAVAACSVLLFHLQVLHIGEAGVDIFFVISGLVIGVTGMRQTPGTFITRRLIRLVPLYWGITVLMCCGALIPGVFSHLGYTPEALIKSLLFIPYTNMDGRIWPLVIPGWSLNYEMLFYVVFAFGLWLRRPLLVCTSILTLSVLMGWLMWRPSPLLIIWTNPLLLEFLVGLWLSRLGGTTRRPLAWIALVLGIGGFLRLASMEYNDIPYRVLNAGIPSLLLVYGAFSLERCGVWPRMKSLERIGDASYSLYLLHGFVIAAGKKLSPPSISHSVEAVIVIIVALVVSDLSYRLVEKRLSDWLKAKWLRRNTGTIHP